MIGYIDGTTENTYKNTMRYNIKGVHKDYRYKATIKRYLIYQSQHVS